jgi:hypothetical protein
VKLPDSYVACYRHDMLPVEPDDEMMLLDAFTEADILFYRTIFMDVFSLRDS